MMALLMTCQYRDSLHIDNKAHKVLSV